MTVLFPVSKFYKTSTTNSRAISAGTDEPANSFNLVGHWKVSVIYSIVELKQHPWGW